MISFRSALLALLVSIEAVACAQYPSDLATKRTERRSRRIIRQWLNSEQLRSWKYDHTNFSMDEETEMLVDSIRNLGGNTAEVYAIGFFYSLHYYITTTQGERSIIRVYFNALRQPMFINNLCPHQRGNSITWEERDEWAPVQCPATGTHGEYNR